jgi:hypothetical protein
MSRPRPTAIAAHITAAKRLLDTLEQHAAAAAESIDGEDASVFLAEVDERGRVVGELSDVLESIARERVHVVRDDQRQADRMIAELTEAATAALESHERLVQRAQAHRDRIATALDRTQRPDAIANQYAAATAAPRPTTISWTG